MLGRFLYILLLCAWSSGRGARCGPGTLLAVALLLMLWLLLMGLGGLGATLAAAATPLAPDAAAAARTLATLGSTLTTFGPAAPSATAAAAAAAATVTFGAATGLEAASRVREVRRKLVPRDGRRLGSEQEGAPIRARVRVLVRVQVRVGAGAGVSGPHLCVHSAIHPLVWQLISRERSLPLRVPSTRIEPRPLPSMPFQAAWLR